MTVRSFKVRAGRLGPERSADLDRLWAAYGLLVGDPAEPIAPLDEPGEPLHLATLFGRVAPVVLEIGSGMGETTVAMAAADPARDLLAVEVHVPGLAALVSRIEAAGLGNVRVARGDAVALLRQLPFAGLDEVRIYFPDPWPKVKHHKRRLVSAAFVELVAERLRPGGLLHVATDWASYAESALAVLAAAPKFSLDGYAPRPAWRPVTRFEARGAAAGRPSYDLLAVRR